MTRRGEDGPRAKLDASDAEAEVPLQVTVPPRVKRSLDVRSAETGRTKRALVLEGLRKVGVDVTAEEIAGRRGMRKS